MTADVITPTPKAASASMTSSRQLNVFSKPAK
jgi:hypothetical protein